MDLAAFKESTSALRHKIDHIVFAWKSMEAIARELASHETVSDFMRFGEIQWDCFEDGCPNVFIRDVAKIKGRHVLFFADFFRPQDIFTQLGVIFSLPRYCATSVTIILAYFPTGTMERVDTEGQVATAHSLARMLSAVPHSFHGPSRLMIYDIHALQERFFFSGGVIPLLVTAIPVLQEQLRTYHADDPIIIAFPDDGAQKRFHNFFKDYECVVCSKVRSGDERIVAIKEGDCNGKHVIIIDDLVRTGGTLLECRKALIKAGAVKTMCYCTHAVFPGESWRRFIQSETNKETFDTFYITNSCPTISDLLVDKPPFKVLSIVGSVANHIATSRAVS